MTSIKSGRVYWLIPIVWFCAMWCVLPNDHARKLINELCTYQCLPLEGGGRAYRGYWHWCLARVWGKWAIIDTGVSPGAGLLTFLVKKDWERVIVHTREELARRPTERAELQNGGNRSDGGGVDSKKGKTLHVFLLLQNTEFWILSCCRN